MSATRTLPRFLRPLASDRRGISAVELGFLAPILALFTVGIGDYGRAFAERYALQQSIHRTLEMALQTGPVAGSYDYLIAEAASAAGVTAQAVTLTTWVECVSSTGVRRTVASSSDCSLAAPAEEYARYVQVRVDTTYRPMFTSAPFPNRRSDGRVPLAAVASLRVQ